MNENKKRYYLVGIVPNCEDKEECILIGEEPPKYLATSVIETTTEYREGNLVSYLYDKKALIQADLDHYRKTNAIEIISRVYKD